MARVLWNAMTGVILCGGLWACVHLMVAALALIDPSRVPQ